jgi:hypothetical protein
MSDNQFVLDNYIAGNQVQRLLDHYNSPRFVADDDAGWEIQRLVQSPAFRPCACGSGIHWAQCAPEYNGYCG